MLFTAIMSKKKVYLYGALVVLFLLSWLFSSVNTKKEGFPERVKIALRDVGNKLLLSNKDTSSLILPILQIEKSKYKLSFQNELSIEPSNLVLSVKNSFEKSSLPSNYRVEVIRCSDKEVGYSYEMKNQNEEDIVPCAGRLLPKGCYTIELKFTSTIYSFFNNYFFLLLALLSVIAFLLEYSFAKRKQAIIAVEEKCKNNIKIGSFQFYPEQNKLQRETKEINLSKKECELLVIFTESLNQIIKRDELTKKVWEDNGVFVGRSLDTYVSKLRKKLSADDTVKIVNVHGVGYKLEVKN